MLLKNRINNGSI
ncbi:Protein of unknown function [Bacillus mycoides]|nr:Protein of unknown function [Bacillus mycoides]